MQLTIIRHGQSVVNLGNWDDLASMDTELTETGRQQAEKLRAWLKQTEATADVLYASTMRRTQETARYVEEALGLSAVWDDRIREIGNVYASGHPIEESFLPRIFSDSKPDKAPFTPRVSDVNGGESWVHFRIRLGQFLHDIMEQHADETVYVVAHGGVISAMFDNLFNVGPYRRCMVDTYNTAWMRCEYRPDADREPWILQAHNRIDHLIGTDLIT